MLDLYTTPYHRFVQFFVGTPVSLSFISSFSRSTLLSFEQKKNFEQRLFYADFMETENESYRGMDAQNDVMANI